MTDFDPRDRFDIPDDREPEHHIPEAVCDDVPTDDVSDSDLGLCPAGGEHTWINLTAWEAGPGFDRGGWRCDECGASPPKEERDDY